MNMNDKDLPSKLSAYFVQLKSNAAKLTHRLFVLIALISAGVSAQEVIPDFYRDPGLYPNRSYVNQGFNEHIDPFTGSLQHHYVDLHLPGNGGFDLKVVRSYNSASVDGLNPAAYESLAGVGWTIHFGRVLKKDTSICLGGATVANNPVIELPDGSRQTLFFTGSTSPLMLTAQRWRAECYSAGLGLMVYSPDGTRYDMTQQVNVGSAVSPIYAWFTTKITDRNGNFADVTYGAGSTPQITGVSTSDGRAISFAYADGGQATRRITSISSAGQTYSYGYQAISGVAGKYFLSSVTRPGGTTWQYGYNSNLNSSPGSYIMNSVTHPEGGLINYGYGFVNFDTQANPLSRSTAVTSKSRSAGGSWSFTYSPGNVGAFDVTTVNTPSGTTVYRHIGPNYSANGTVWMVGLLMSKTIGGVQSETYTWGKQKISSQNNFRPGAFVLKVDTGEVNAPVLTQKTVTRDGASYSTSYSAFDSYGNPASMAESGTSGGNRTTNLSYYINTTKWIIKQVQNESFTSSSISRVFDASGNMQSITRDGVSTSYSYDAQGNITSIVFPRSLTHSYSSYKRGIPQTESQPEGIAISRIVSDAGNVTSETNGDNRTTAYTYDGLNRVTSITYPAGSPVAISYAAASKSASRGSLVESTSYNGFGQVVSVTLGGIVSTFTVDALGRMTFESDPGASSGTSYQHDMLDRSTRITNADSTFQAISYGSGSKTVTDERSKSTVYSYRAYGNPDQQFLMGISAAESSASISIARNSKDLITSVSQGGLTRSYGYNSNYYLSSVINPETGSTSYGRDAAGNMTSRAVGASGSSIYTYDGQNRLTSVTYPGATPSVSNTYNKTHKLLTANSTTGNRSFSYDANGNLIAESLSVDGQVFTASYGYNSLDQLSSTTYPRSGAVVNYSPDSLGRPTAISGYISSVSYWPSGQVRQINYANGTVTNYNQNSRLWPSTFSTNKSGGTTYINSSYSYDGVGNLLSIGDSVDSTYNRTLSYDNINRLTGTTGPWGAGSIAYNGVGNITSQILGGSSLSYSYDSSNRLSNVSGIRSASYGYDAYANITSDSTKSYTYDGVPNLRCVDCNSAIDKTEFGYDGINQRSMVSKAGKKTYEMYGSSGNQLIEFTPSEANKLVEYIYLGGKRIAQKQTGGLVASTVNVVATPNPALVGSVVNLTANVAGSAPTGTVTFSNGAVILGTSNVVAGQATLSTSFAAAGSNSIKASYSGDALNAGSSSTVVNLAINKSATSTGLAITPNPGLVGSAVTLIATVTGNAPTGVVTFMSGATNLGSAAIVAGQATLSTSFSAAGINSITANYGGDASNAVSTSGVANLAINRSTSNTVLTATPSSALIGSSVSLVATVTGNAPTGVVTFTNGAATLGTGTIIAGQATFSTAFPVAGAQSITASYAGDVKNDPSAATSINVQVMSPAVLMIPILQLLLDDE
jgi:YD repeat-containing protein